MSISSILQQRVESFWREDLWPPIQSGWATVNDKLEQHDVANLPHRLDSFCRKDVWPALQTGWKTSVNTAQSAKELAKTSYTSIATWIEHVRENPPVYQELLGDSTEIFVRLPYVGPVTLDVFAFGASAILFRIYIFWRARRKTFGGDSGYTLGRRDSSSPMAKAKQVENKEQFQDPSLRQTMQECDNIKSNLRRVQDPELARREKRRQMKINNMKSGKGVYLGMSEDNLQRARKHLKNIKDYDASRRPLGSKNTMV